MKLSSYKELWEMVSRGTNFCRAECTKMRRPSSCRAFLRRSWRQHAVQGCHWMGAAQRASRSQIDGELFLIQMKVQVMRLQQPVHGLSCWWPRSALQAPSFYRRSFFEPHRHCQHAYQNKQLPDIANQRAIKNAPFWRLFISNTRIY